MWPYGPGFRAIERREESLVRMIGASLQNPQKPKTHQGILVNLAAVTKAYQSHMSYTQQAL